MRGCEKVEGNESGTNIAKGGNMLLSFEILIFQGTDRSQPVRTLKNQDFECALVLNKTGQESSFLPLEINTN